MNIKQCLGIDIGGTSTKYALVSQLGEIVDEGSFATGFNITAEQFLPQLFSIIEKVIAQNIGDIGIGTVGVVDEFSSKILSGVDNIPMLRGMNLKELIESEFKKTNVYVCNDVEAAARGEYWIGSASNASSFYYITLGTGLGGAYFLHGQPIKGVHNRAGEIAYLDYVTEGEYLETKISTYHVMRETAQKLGRTSLNGFEFFDFIRAKEPQYINVLDEWLDRIAKLISNLIIIFDPEMVILGGGISNEREILLEPLRKRIQNKLPLEFRYDSALFDLAALGGKTGIIGAASQCFIF